MSHSKLIRGVWCLVASVRGHTQARDHLLAPAPAAPLVEWRELRREPPRSQPVLTYISRLSVLNVLNYLYDVHECKQRYLHYI